MLNKEWGAESNGKLPHCFMPSKIGTLVPEFAMEDLPSGRIAALVPEFAVKDLPLGRPLMIYIFYELLQIKVFLELFPDVMLFYIMTDEHN